jgi:hypothetical protein
LDRIKSAYEMAMERFKGRKEVPPEEIEKMEYATTGKTLAAKFLWEKEFDFLKEINKHPDKIKGHILAGAQEVFLSNIQMPTDEATLATTKKALEGMFIIKSNKEALKEVSGQMEHLFNYYKKTIEQAYSQFKDSFSARIAASMKSIEQKVGNKIKIDPEKQPGFREEWMRAVSSLNDQYNNLLAEQKEKMKKFK